MPSNDTAARRRAGVVCIQCHARKVRCDLQYRQDNQCINCRKANQPCLRRQGSRKRSTQVAAASTPISGSSVSHANEESANQTEPLHDRRDESAVDTEIGGPPDPSPQSRNAPLGYLGEESFLSNTCMPEIRDAQPTEATIFAEAILRATHATVLPPPPLVDALVEVYFRCLFPLLPVVDRRDLTARPQSILLMQCICMVGSHFRHPPKSTPIADQFYWKIKTLLSIGHEEDTLTTLKSLCLIATRSSESPTRVSLNSPWHWVGVATRYALNMGLHREMTYGGLSNPGMSRRVWWHLFNQDKLQSLCYGRPSAIRLPEVDVRAPNLQDFAVSHPDNEIFIQRTKLCLILGKVADAQYGQQRKPKLEEIANIGENLREWIRDLPEGLHLYDESFERKPYRRHASELHIMYFTCIILFYRLVENPRLCLDSLKVSVVAASGIAWLFEELHYRGDMISLLPINNWYCMVASVPLIHAIARLSENNALLREDLSKIRLVLQEMKANSPSTNLIIANLDRVQRSILGINGSPVQPRIPEDNGGSLSESEVSCSAQCHRIDPLRLFPYPPTICSSMNLLPLGNRDTVDAEAMPNLQFLDGESDLMFNFDLCDVQMDQFLTQFEVS